jgi:hypothetical protein
MILSGDTDLIARSLWLFWAFYGVPWVTEGHCGALGDQKRSRNKVPVMVIAVSSNSKPCSIHVVHGRRLLLNWCVPIEP